MCYIHFPVGGFRPIQIQYIVVVVCVLHLVSGRNIPSNTKTIHIYCCCACVVFIFRPEYSVKYKYNTLLLLLLFVLYSFSYRKIPGGIFRQIQIQYKCIVFIFNLYLYLGRNIPLNTNTIQYKCNLTDVSSEDIFEWKMFRIFIYIFWCASGFDTLPLVVLDVHKCCFR